MFEPRLFVPEALDKRCKSGRQRIERLGLFL